MLNHAYFNIQKIIIIAECLIKHASFLYHPRGNKHLTLGRIKLSGTSSASRRAPRGIIPEGFAWHYTRRLRVALYPEGSTWDHTHQKFRIYIFSDYSTWYYYKGRHSSN